MTDRHPTPATDPQNDSAAALAVALQTLERSPDDPQLLERTIELLAEWDRFDEALACIDHLGIIDPERARVARARTLEAMNQIMESAQLWREIHHDDPGDHSKLVQCIRVLTRAREFDDAMELIDALRDRRPSGNHWQHRAQVLNVQNRRIEAFEMGLAEVRAHPDHEGRLRATLRFCHRVLTKDVASGAEPAAHELLDLVLAGPRDDALILHHAANVAVTLGRDDDAITLINTPCALGRPDKFDRLRAWAAYTEGDVDEARRIWDRIRTTQSVEAIRPLHPGELSRRDTLPMQLDADRIRVFTVIRNERWRLPWFFSYYRALGVDEFYVVDNDSTDGSLELLLEQPDVRVFHTDTPYRIGRSGMVWLNHLTAQFNAGWNVYVDVDEALVYDDIESHGLRGLTDHMDRHGHDIACGQMVDMFAVETPGEEPTEAIHDFVTEYPYFDHTYQRVPTHQCPYFFTTGGIRRLAATGENQTKSPVSRAGRGIQFLSSSHVVTPGVISDVDIGLLHFKLAGDFRRAFSEDSASNDRVGDCRNRYDQYAEFYADWTGASDALDWSTIGRFERSTSLVDHGLIAGLPPTFR